MRSALATLCIVGSIALGGLNINAEDEPPSRVNNGLYLDTTTTNLLAHTRIRITPGDSQFDRDNNQRLLMEQREAKRDTTSRANETVQRYSTNELQSTNTYPYGWCTWYAASKSPSVRNGWGNARDWPINSQEPQAGGVVKLKSSDPRGHVAYIEEVKETTIVISEMNYAGWDKVSFREIPMNDKSIIGFFN